jgi:FkbM family methyltransferase
MRSLLPVALTKYLDMRAADHEFVFSATGSRIRRSFYKPMQSPAFEGFPVRKDELLFEWIDLLTAIETAEETFTMVELGAGYGRWLVAGAVAARRVRNLQVHLVGVEAEHAHFEMMRQHFTDNDIDPGAHTLLEKAAAETDGPVHFVQGHSSEWWGQSILPSPEYGFGDWPEAQVSSAAGLCLATIIHDLRIVDLIDMDVQGAEAAVVRGSRQALIDKVKRVHIGTHNAVVEAELLNLFDGMGWLCQNQYPCHSAVVTEFGEISFEDGVQTWINPKLV